MKKLLALVILLSASVSWASPSQDLMTIAHDPQFQDRVNYFVVSASIAVMAEDPNTPFHPGRVAFANKVLSGNYNVLFCTYGVLTNTTIAAEANVKKSGNDYLIPDSDINFTVNSEYNAFAGVSN